MTVKACSRCGYQIEDYLAFCDLCQRDIDAERAATPNTVTRVLASDWWRNAVVVAPNLTFLDWLLTALPIPESGERWSVGKINGVPYSLVLWGEADYGMVTPYSDIAIIFGREVNANDKVDGKHIVGLDIPLGIAVLCETATVVEFGEPWQRPAHGPLSMQLFVEMKPRLRTYTVKPYTGD